jgi:hypothetical protein
VHLDNGKLDMHFGKHYPLTSGFRKLGRLPRRNTRPHADLATDFVARKFSIFMGCLLLVGILRQPTDYAIAAHKDRIVPFVSQKQDPLHKLLLSLLPNEL